MREKERDRQTDRQTDRPRPTDRQTDYLMNEADDKKCKLITELYKKCMLIQCYNVKYQLIYPIRKKSLLNILSLTFTKI